MTNKLDRITPVGRQHTPSLIANQLRDLITDGTLAAGTQLREKVLSERLGVSRGPLREAIASLYQEGLLNVEPNRGAFVIELGSEDIIDIYTARTPIEEFAASRVAKSRDAKVIQHLQSITLRMQSAEKRHNWLKVVDIDLEFHEALVAGAGSSRISRMFATLLSETRMCIAGLRPSYDHAENLTAEHVRLIEVIETGTTAQIRRELRGHMNRAVRDLTSPRNPEPFQ